MPRSLPAKSYKLTEAFWIHTVGSQELAYTEDEVESLRAWYRFEDTTSSRFLEKLGDSAIGSLSGGTYHGDVYATLDTPSSLDTAEMYRSVRFSQNYSDTPYINIGESARWENLIGNFGSAQYTISAWIKPESSGEGNRGTIMQFGGQGPPGLNPGTSGFRLFTYSGPLRNEGNRVNSIGYRADFSENDFVATTDSNIFVPGEWIHVVITHDLSDASNEDAVHMYINGEEISFSKQHPSNDNLAAGIFQGIEGGYLESCIVGNAATSDATLNRLFDGVVDEIAIWDTVLDGQTILAVYHSRLGIPDVSSGYLNNPVRVLQLQKDSELGSYPSILRSGPDKFFGNEKIQPYDDTKLITFNSAYASAWVYFHGRPHDASTITLFDPAGSIDLLPATAKTWTKLDDLTVAANQDLQVEQVYETLIISSGSFGNIELGDSLNSNFSSADAPTISGPWVGIKNVDTIDINAQDDYGMPTVFSQDADGHYGISCKITIESFGIPDLAVDGDGDTGTFSIQLLDEGGVELIGIGTDEPGTENAPIPMTSEPEYIVDLATPEQQVDVDGKLDGLKISWPNPYNSDFGATAGDTGDSTDQTVEELYNDGNGEITADQLIMYIAEPYGLNGPSVLQDLHTGGSGTEEDPYTYPENPDGSLLTGLTLGEGSGNPEDIVAQLYNSLIADDPTPSDYFNVTLDSPDRFIWRKANLEDYKHRNKWTDWYPALLDENEKLVGQYIGTGNVRLDYTTVALKSSGDPSGTIIYAEPISLDSIDSISGSIPTAFSVKAYARGDISADDIDEYYTVEYSFHNRSDDPSSFPWTPLGEISELRNSQRSPYGPENSMAYEYSGDEEDDWSDVDPDQWTYAGRHTGPMAYAPFADGHKFSDVELEHAAPGYTGMPNDPHFETDPIGGIPTEMTYEEAYYAGEVTNAEYLAYVAAPAGLHNDEPVDDTTTEGTAGTGTSDPDAKYGPSKLYFRFHIGDNVSWGRCQVKLAISYTGRPWYFDDIDNEDGSGNNIRLNWDNFSGHNYADWWQINVEDSTQETFEFNRGRITNPVYTEVKIRGVRSRDSINTLFARAVNQSGLQIDAHNDGKRVKLYQTMPGDVGNLEIHADKRTRCHISHSKEFQPGSEGEVTGSFKGGNNYLVSYPTGLPAQVQMTDPSGALLWKDESGNVASAGMAGMRSDPSDLDSSGNKLYTPTTLTDSLEDIIITAVQAGWDDTRPDVYADPPTSNEYVYYDDAGIEIIADPSAPLGDHPSEPWSSYAIRQKSGVRYTEEEFMVVATYDEHTGYSPALLSEEEWLAYEGLTIPVYPDSPWLNERIATPHSESHLISTGSTSKGVSDTEISFEQSFSSRSPFEPFADDQIDIDIENEFYDEGVSANVYEGLSGPLKSKTQIVIPLNTVAPTTVGYNNRQKYNFKRDEVYGTGLTEHLFDFFYEYGKDPSGETLTLTSDLMLTHEQTNKISVFARGDIDQNRPDEYFDIAMTWEGDTLYPIIGTANSYTTIVDDTASDDVIIHSGDDITIRASGLRDAQENIRSDFDYDDPHFTVSLPAGKITNVAVIVGVGVNYGINQVLLRVSPKAYSFPDEPILPGTGATPGSKETKIFNHMTYYNFSKQIWEPIGPGVSTQISGSLGHQQFFEDACIGFSRGVELMQSGSATAALPITSFGFPAHPKFSAKPSQLLSLRDQITRPFVLEKFVLEYEAAWAEGEDYTKRSIMYEVSADGKILRTDEDDNYYNKAAINNFFILNQRGWRGVYDYRSEGQSTTYWYYPSYMIRVTQGHSNNRHNRYMWDGSDYPYDKNRYLKAWYRFNAAGTGIECVESQPGSDDWICLAPNTECLTVDGITECWPKVGKFGNSVDPAGTLPEFRASEIPPSQVSDDSPWLLPAAVDSSKYDYSLKFVAGDEQYLEAPLGDFFTEIDFKSEFEEKIETGDTSSYYYNKGIYTNFEEESVITNGTPLADFDPEDPDAFPTTWCYKSEYDQDGEDEPDWNRRDFVLLPINEGQEPDDWKYGLRIWNDNKDAAGKYVYMYNRRFYRRKPLTGRRTIQYHFVQAPGTNINQELVERPDPGMENFTRPDGTPYGSEALRFQVRHELGTTEDYDDWIDLVVHEPEYTKAGMWQRASITIDPQALFGDADQEYYIRFAQNAATYPDTWMISDLDIRFSFSVGMWFKSGGTISRVTNLLCIADAEGKPNKLWLALYENKLHLMVDSGKNRVYRRGATPDEMVDGEWHHAIFTYNHTTYTNRLHVDGEYIAEYKLPQKSDDDGDLIWIKGTDEVTVLTAEVTEQDLYDFGIINSTGAQAFEENIFQGIDTTGDGLADIAASEAHEFDGTEIKSVEGIDITLIEEEYMQALGYAPILPWEFELTDLCVIGADVDAHKLQPVEGWDGQWNDVVDGTGDPVNISMTYAEFDLDDPPFTRSQLNGAITTATTPGIKFNSLEAVEAAGEFETVKTYDNFYHGNISDIAIWSTVLSGLDARALYHLSNGGYYRQGLGTDITLAGTTPFKFSVPLDTNFEIRVPSIHESNEEWFPGVDNEYATYDIADKLLARYLVDPNNFKVIESPDFRDVSISDELTGVLIGSPDYADDGPWSVPELPTDIRISNDLRYSLNFHDNNFFVKLPRSKDLWTPAEVPQMQLDKDGFETTLSLNSYPAFSVFAWVKMDAEQDKADPVIFSINKKSGLNRLIFFIDTADFADTGTLGDRICIHARARPKDKSDNTEYSITEAAKWDNWYRITTNDISNVWEDDGYGKLKQLKTIKDGKWHQVGFTYTPAPDSGSHPTWEIYVDGIKQAVHQITNLDISGPKNDIFLHEFASDEDGDHANSAFSGNLALGDDENWERYQKAVVAQPEQAVHHLNLEFDDLDRVSIGQEYDRTWKRKYTTFGSGQRVYKTYRVRKASQHFDGKIAEFTMWQSALSGDDVKKLYNSRYGTAEVTKWFNKTVSTSREMVTYGQWLIYKNITQSPVDINDVLEQGLEREVSTEATMKELDDAGLLTGEIVDHDGEPDTQVVVSGSYVMEGIVKRPIKHQNGSAYQVGVRAGFSGTKSLYKTSHNGTRTGLDHDLGTSRTIFNAVPGVDMLESHLDFGRERRGLDQTELDVFQQVRKESPYILYPTDNLILGWQCATPFDFKRTTDAGTGPHLTLGQNATEDVPTRMKLTLYGSYLQDGKGRQDDLNQNLTSDAIHEALHFESPAHDSFHLDCAGYMFGSYMDNIVSGSMFVNEVYGKEIFGKIDEQGFRAGFKALRLLPSNYSRILKKSTYAATARRSMLKKPTGWGSKYKRPLHVRSSQRVKRTREDVKHGVIARRRIASIADATQKTIGSMLRGVRLIDSYERYFDSVVAPPSKYHAFNGNGVLQWSSPLFRGGRKQTSLVFGEPRPSDEKIILPEKTNIRCQKDGWYQPVPKGVIKLTFRRLWTADDAYGGNLHYSSGVDEDDLVDDPQLGPIVGDGEEEGREYAGEGYAPLDSDGNVIDDTFSIASENDGDYDGIDVPWYILRSRGSKVDVDPQNDTYEDDGDDIEMPDLYVTTYKPYAQGYNYIGQRNDTVDLSAGTGYTSYIEIHDADNKKYALWFNWNNGAAEPDDENIDKIIEVDLDLDDSDYWTTERVHPPHGGDGIANCPADVAAIFAEANPTFGITAGIPEDAYNGLFPRGARYMSAKNFTGRIISAIQANISSEFELLEDPANEGNYYFSEGLDVDGEERCSIYLRTRSGGLVSPELDTSPTHKPDYDGGGIPGIHYNTPRRSTVINSYSYSYLYSQSKAYMRGRVTVGTNNDDLETWQTANWQIDATKGYDWQGNEYDDFAIVTRTHEAEDLINDYRLMSSDWGVTQKVSEYIEVTNAAGATVSPNEDGSIDEVANPEASGPYQININSGLLANSLGLSGNGVDEYVGLLRPNNTTQFLHQSDVTETASDGFVRVSGYTLDGTWIQIHDAKDNAYNLWYILDDGDSSSPPTPTTDGTLVYVKPPPGAPASTVAEMTAEVLNSKASKVFKTSYETGNDFFTVENIQDGSTKDADSTIMGLPLTTGFYLVDEEGAEYDNEFSFWSFMWGGILGLSSFSKTTVDAETYTSGTTPEGEEPYWHGDPVVEGVDPYHENTNSLIDAYWLGSYPFESRYASLARGRWRRSSEPWNVTTWDEDSGEFMETAGSVDSYSTVIITGSNMPSIIEDPTLENDPSYPVLTLVGDGTSYAPNTALTAADNTKNNFYKFYFGSGDNWQKNPAVEIEYLYSDGYTWPSAVPKIRGWKYGLISALPSNSSAVFRHDSFGQFRDMLEQRPFTRFFKSTLRGKYHGRSRISAPAVRVRFVDNEGSLTRAKNTWSQNLSAFCTSSLPFFDDGTPRNRELDVDELDTTLVTVGSLT